MALDRVNNRMFVPEPGNIRILVYQLDERGHHVRHTADNVIGHSSLLGRRRQSNVNRTDVAGGAENGLAVDNVYQRLFARDRNRILVFEIDPEGMADYPEATHVIGQPDFETLDRGTSRQQFSGAGIIVDDEYQRLFVEDLERILVFDVHPDRLEDYPEASIVIGQPNFNSRLRGTGKNRLSRSHGMAFDPDQQRLFISDQQNNRILVFDVDPSRLHNEPDAIAVLGQPDFETTGLNFVGATARPEDRRGFRHIVPGGLDYDPVHQRLFVSQLIDNRILVFEASPEKLEGELEAFAVIGQPDFTTFEPMTSRSRFAFPKDPSVDPDKQILYVSEGFPGGNRILAFDIRPGSLKNGLEAVDVIGHVDDFGEDDFDSRVANDRLDARTVTAARAVALDTVDHRLWAADEYNNRVIGFQLDTHNRLLDREASWVFGQNDFHTAHARRTRTGMNVPLAVAYDEVDKRLYVGDGWYDRVLVYEADPDILSPGGAQEAAFVLGQLDFETQDSRPARNRFDLGVDLGKGIASSMLPVGIAIDQERRRVFIADGGNHRILVFDIHRDHLRNGADAIGVIGQPDFTSKEPRLAADGLSWPGHLAYDADGDRLFAVDNRHGRVLVYNSVSTKIAGDAVADFVIGQPDFTTINDGNTEITAKSMAFPNGVTFDSARQRLYVSDQGNNRVLVFDVAPERMKNQPTALAVLGQRDAVSSSSQILADVSAQDQIYDPRGLAFDSKHQQLYVTDSHWARLLVFNFHETSRRLEMPANGTRNFSSLDPFMALSAWEVKSGYGQIAEMAQVNAAWTLTRSAFSLEPLTEQQSRILISQSSTAIKPLSTTALSFLDGRKGAKTAVSVVNPGDKASEVRLTIQLDSRRRETITQTLQPRARLIVWSDELIERGFTTATLRIDSRSPVSVSAWTERENREGEMLLTALPVAVGNPVDSEPVLANITLGGGYQTEIVLLNADQEIARGVLHLLDGTGKEFLSHGYAVDPGGTLLWQPPAAGLIPKVAYAVARSESDSVAHVFSLTTRADEGLVTMTSGQAVSGILRAQIPINTMPDLIRHGRNTTLTLAIANDSTHGASVRMILLNLEGSAVDRAEQLILPGMQREFTFGGLFDQTKFVGSLVLVSDVHIAVSARQTTVNVRGDEILTELPILTKPSGGPLLFPYIDGNGLSTQLSVVAGPEGSADSTIDFFQHDGEPLAVILR